MADPSDNPGAAVLDCVVAIDSTGIVRAASASVRAVLGWEPDEWLGREFERFLPAGCGELREGTREFALRRKDGTALVCEQSIARIDVPAMGGPLFVCSLRDVTARRDAEQREARMLKSLAAIGESASLLVHDIKNPITGIQLAVQAVADQLGVDSREILQGLEASLQKLQRTMRRTLTFAQPIQPRLQALVPSRLLDAVAQRARPARVEIECGKDLPQLEADEALLEEALWNLVQNSLEALESGGRVRLTARRAEGGALELSVEDDGPGIPASVLPDLFKPFHTTKEQGTGLGLALSRKIADAHGAEIRAERSVLGGARFTIRLRPIP